MNGPEHYREAERLLEEAARQQRADHFSMALASWELAKVHATLALTAATAQAPYPSPRNRDDWSQAFAAEPPAIPWVDPVTPRPEEEG